MTTTDFSAGYATHEVHNQAGALANYNAYVADTALTEAMRVFGGDWAEEKLKRTGEIVGSEKVQQLARAANRHLPELRTHDRFGNRVDIIEFHPAYHELMRLIFETETHSFAWTNDRAGAQVARGVMSYLWNQGENGICCPMGMTFAAVPALRHTQSLYDEWTPHVPARDLRRAADLRQAEAGHHGRHGDDREAGRLGSARDDHDRAASDGCARGGRRISDHRPQVVLLGADERHFSDAGADREGAFRVPRHRLDAGRLAQPAQTPAAEGQVRQQVERRLRRSSSTTSMP